MNPVPWAFTAAPMEEPAAVEALSAKPEMMVIGEEDVTAPRLIVESMFRGNWPDALFISLPNVSHYTKKYAPRTLVAMVRAVRK